MRIVIACVFLLACPRIAFALTPAVVTESQKILGSYRNEYASLGKSISIQGNTALISAYFDGSVDQGFVYSFQKDDGGQWHETQKFTVPGLSPQAGFGGDVSVFGDYAVVGAFQHRIQRIATGAAYLFHRDAAGIWTLSSGLLPEESTTFLGLSVAMGDGIAAVSTTDLYSKPAAVYLFAPDSAGQWRRSGKLFPSDFNPGQGFANSIALSGQRLIAGSPTDNDHGTFSGSAYIFDSLATGGSQSAKLTSLDSTANDRFGSSVALSGDIAVVGAPGDNSAYVFRENSLGNWQQLAKLTVDGAMPLDAIGGSVAIWNNFVLVGNDIDNSRTGSPLGAAYLFKFDEIGNWSHVATFRASDGKVNGFGWSIGIDEGSIIIGASADNELSTISGAAYAYPFVPEPSSLCISILSLIPTVMRRRRSNHTQSSLHLQLS